MPNGSTMVLNIYLLVWMYTVKKADMIPLMEREQITTTKAFAKILDNMGIPKVYILIRDQNLKLIHFKIIGQHNI
jgi:hypothetical protein